MSMIVLGKKAPASGARQQVSKFSGMTCWYSGIGCFLAGIKLILNKLTDNRHNVSQKAIWGGEKQMVPERISMRKIKEILRLHYEAGLSQTTIAMGNHISRYTVQQYIMHFTASGLNWPHGSV